MNKHILLSSVFSVLAFIPGQVCAQQAINPAQLLNIILAEATVTNDLTEISQAEVRLTNSTLATAKYADQSQIVSLLQKLSFDETPVSVAYQAANVTLVDAAQTQLTLQVNELIAQNQILEKVLAPPPKGPMPLSTVIGSGNVNTQAVLNATRNVLLAELNLASTMVMKTVELQPLPYGPLSASESQYFLLTNIINSTSQQIAALNGPINPK